METVALDEKEEEQLWKEYKRTKSAAIRDRLVRQYMPLVKHVAGKVHPGMPASVEYDDLVSFGQFGLLDAIEKFDPDKNIKFKTYAVVRIRGSMLDELREMDWVPRSVRQKAREIEDTIVQLEAKLGRPASEQEIADDMNISLDDYHSLVMKVSGTSILSLNDVFYSNDENEHTSIGDTIEAPSAQNPDFIVERKDIHRLITNAINELPQNEKLVIVLYYHEDLTFKEIGKVLDVSESRVSQLHSTAILRLKGKLTNFKKGIF